MDATKFFERISFLLYPEINNIIINIKNKDFNKFEYFILIELEKSFKYWEFLKTSQKTLDDEND